MNRCSRVLKLHDELDQARLQSLPICLSVCLCAMYDYMIVCLYAVYDYMIVCLYAVCDYMIVCLLLGCH